MRIVIHWNRLSRIKIEKYKSLVCSLSRFLLFLNIWQVFSKGTMDAFILRSIYPKLSQCLSEFIINPHQQHLGRLNLNIPI